MICDYCCTEMVQIKQKIGDRLNWWECPECKLKKPYNKAENLGKGYRLTDRRKRGNMNGFKKPEQS